MTVEILDTVGLTLNILGVAIVFRYGFPQPSHSEAFAYKEPESVIGRDRKARNDKLDELTKRKKTYRRLSQFALVLMVSGWACQVGAIWLPRSGGSTVTVPGTGR